MVLILLIASFTVATVAANIGRGRKYLAAFDYKSVSLYAGKMRTEFDETRDFLLRIPIEDLLRGFRERAKLSAPGSELGGHYTADQGNVFPQILSALARMSSATSDFDCREKANALLTEWGKTIGPDGYFFYSNHPTSRHYFYEKMVGALVDMYIYCERVDALDYLSTITDWAIKNLNQDREYGNASGEINDPLCDHAQWYTTSENLYRAYLVTGNQKYKDFAAVWEYSEFWDLFATRRDIFSTRLNGQRTEEYHASSHVNSFSGAGAAYVVTGHSHYLEVIRNAYDFMLAGQVFATGGYGPDEQLLTPSKVIESLGTTEKSFETQCGSWAAFKLCKYLLTLTGEANYGDWVERLVINGIGASLKMTDWGQLTYYSNYHYGPATKELNDNGTWPCCAGSRPMAVADYYDQIYFYDPGSLYVNLFTQARVRWKHNGQWVALTQRTRFPEIPETTLRISIEQPARLAVKVRIPSWVSSPVSFRLNGNPIAPSSETRQWAVFDRIWREGDKLAVTFPMKPWKCHLNNDPSAPFVVMYGPVALAFRSFGGNPKEKLYLNNLEDSLVPVLGDRLNFHLLKDPNILVRPYYDFRHGEPYYLYLE